MTRTDPFLRARGAVDERSVTTPTEEVRQVSPEELSRWLHEHQEAMAERWYLEVRSRGDEMDRELSGLVREFLWLLTKFLAPGMGAYRDQIEPIFQQAAELYGNLGAHRGQAAGEAVEEFQLLREVVLRFLHTDAPGEGEGSIGLRELLQLNRLIDLGVTYSSIGHTDSLFFNLFHGTGVSETPTPALLEEVREQVAGLDEELNRLLTHEMRRDSLHAN